MKQTATQIPARGYGLLLWNVHSEVTQQHKFLSFTAPCVSHVMAPHRKSFNLMKRLPLSTDRHTHAHANKGCLLVVLTSHRIRANKGVVL